MHALSEILRDLRTLDTSRAALRKFGLLVGGVFLAIGVLLMAKSRPAYPWFVTPGVVLMLGGALFPRGLKAVYIAWMAAAFVLGFIVSHVVLAVFFFLVITPVGLVARVFGKDFLRLSLDRSAASYWLPRKQNEAKTPADYERQF